MKKIAILGALALLLTVGAVSAASGYILAGNATTARAYTDSWWDFYLVDTNNPFAYDAKVTAWNIYASQNRPMGFMVYRYDGTAWSVVYDGSTDLKTPLVGEHTFNVDPPLEVQKGDFVGLYFGAQGGVVAFDKPDGEPWDRGNLTGKVLFTNIGGLPTAFIGSSDRVYSVSAEGSVIVTIDIKPGSDPNCVNVNDHGVIPVAILGSADLDVAQINPETVMLQGLAVKMAGKSNKLLAHYEDINYDGYIDLVVQIEDTDGAFVNGNGQATLSGNLYDGTPVEGTDSICIVP